MGDRAEIKNMGTFQLPSKFVNNGNDPNLFFGEKKFPTSAGGASAYMWAK